MSSNKILQALFTLSLGVFALFATPIHAVSVSSTTNAVVGNNNNTLSWSHNLSTGGGGTDNRKLIVGVGIEEDDSSGHDVVTSVTVGGAAMTRAGQAVVASSGFLQRVEVWYMDDVDLPNGNRTIQIRTTGNVREISGGAILFVDALQGALPIQTNTNTGSNSISTNITTLADNSIVVDVVGSGNPNTFTQGGGQTERWDSAQSIGNWTSAAAASTKLVASAGTTTMTQNQNANRLAHVVLAIAPDTYVPPPPPPPGSGFCDDFESGLALWALSDSSRAGISNQTSNSPSQSLYTRHGVVTVTSQVVDMNVPAGKVTAWIRRGDDSFSEDPDNGEDLEIQYLNNSAVWTTLETFPGNGTAGEVFTRNYNLPADALHVAFQLRFRQTGGDGPDWDYWHVDDVCILPEGPVAYYNMDEPLWDGTSGEVLDSTINNNHADTIAIGTATRPSTSNASSAIPGNPGTCGYGEIPLNTSANIFQAIDTGIDVDDDIGSQGTITFWYKSNNNWNGGGDRMLLDATRSGSDNKYFYLVLQNDSRLEFGLEDSADRDFRFETANNGFVADEWVHIAITWNLVSRRMRIYTNGTLANTYNVPGNTTGVVGELNSLYIGDNRVSDYIVGDMTGNSANGSFDEVRIYDSARTQPEIDADRLATHPCVAQINHIQIEHDGIGITCAPETITFKACSSADCSSLYTGDVTVDLVSTDGSWSSTNPVTISGGQTDFDLQDVTAGITTISVANPSPAASQNPVYTCINSGPGNPCDIEFFDSGFVFNIPTQTSCATSANVIVQAVATDPATSQCVPLFASVNKSLKAWTTYLAPADGDQIGNPAVDLTSNLSTPVTVTLPSDGNVPAADNISLDFDTNGEATFTVEYPDAGELQLDFQFDGTGSEAGIQLLGNDSFVTQPARLNVSSPDAASACVSGDDTCTPYVSAGSNFNINVSASCANGNITPNFRINGISLSSNLVAPATGINATLGLTTVNMVKADNGNKLINNQTVNEVGVFTITATPPANYLGVPLTTAAGTSPNLGRFYPAYFETAVTNACTAGTTPYTYSGQPFPVTMTAFNLSGAVTTNYFGGFVKNPEVKDKTDTYTLTNNVFDGTTHFTAVAAGSATNTDVTLTFVSKETAPATVTIEANSENDTPSPATLDDITSDTHTEGNVLIRSGRLLMNNVYGSELATLMMPVLAQYYDGNNYITNSDDACSSVALANLTLTTAVESLDGTNPIRIKAGSAQTTTATIDYTPLAAGELGLNFSPTCAAPCNDGDGNVLTVTDLGASGANLPWLQYDWDGDGNHDNNPSATASFGLYRGDDRIIFQREVLP